MFSGIVEERGQVQAIKQERENLQLIISCRKVLEGTEIGDSIAVNGICLTVTSKSNNSFTADIMPETVRRTQFRQLETGSYVNLERSLVYGGRVSGHLVQGHVDTVGKVIQKTPEQNATLIEIEYDPKWNRYLIEKGSIAVNGISLTVVDVFPNRFTVSIIPHTLQQTNLEMLQPNDLVNLEFDMLAKYFAKWSQKEEVIL